jgi:dolichyl-diphosphooligosaccharide--protein glycosyltransferase
MPAKPPTAAKSAASFLYHALHWTLRLSALAFIVREAYRIRLYAITDYGRVIHEFDPWFNFRATQYLADNGYDAFFKWFDYKSWYPLGRPVGTTIYPGMQITSVLIWKALNAIGAGKLPFALPYITGTGAATTVAWVAEYDVAMSLNDVCVFVPAWFGALATIFLGLLTYECARGLKITSAAWAGVAAAGIMAIVPAHIMRSVGGGFDNESVAVTAMCATFYFWVRSLRADDPHAHRWGVVTGLAYINMVAAWGGYIFVLNMIGVHTACLVAMGRYSRKLCYSYCLFYFIGTAGAMQVPVVGWTPLKSLEQLGPCLCFLIMVALEVCESRRRAGKYKFLSFANTKVYLAVGLACAAALAAVVAALLPTGYFGPLSSRIRGLFVKHTRTGNPLVDSVAEHQPATQAAYYQYLHYSTYPAFAGGALCLLGFSDAKSFLVAYIAVAYYFSAKMMRLILLMGPITSALAGLALGFAADWCVDQALLPMGVFKWAFPLMLGDAKEDEEEEKAADADADADAADADTDADAAEKKKPAAAAAAGPSLGARLTRWALLIYNSVPVCLLRMAAAAKLCQWAYPHGRTFYDYSHQLAVGMSHPSIMFKGKLQNGETIIVDDYREAYWWLRDNTPEDARVMAWWDYGYQLAGIANRTTIADGNTWNHEHIATLGRALTSPEKEAHRMVRHLADYVLLWTGGGGDDLAKSPHMARIGNSVYEDICPGDPTCQRFGFMQGGVPTKMMSDSLLYRLHSGGQQKGVYVDPNRFKNVYNSKYNKVRIWKVLAVSEKSKAWAADPANRKCDAPGSWYCVGRYPPALRKLFKKKGIKKKSFAQLEDFNKKKSKKDEAYQKAYMDKMAGKGGAGGAKEAQAAIKEAQEKAKAAAAKLPKEQQAHRRRRRDAALAAAKAMKWADSEASAQLYKLVAAGDTTSLEAWITAQPDVVHLRSADGRGPLWWANELGQAKVAKLLKSYGCQKTLKDKGGKKPSALLKKNKKAKKAAKKAKKEEAKEEL